MAKDIICLAAEKLIEEGLSSRLSSAKLIAETVLIATKDMVNFSDPSTQAGGNLLGVGRDKPLHWTTYKQAQDVWKAMVDAVVASDGQPASR